MASGAKFDLGLGLEGTHVLVTGGCGLIGRIVVQAFLAAGCNVTVFDLAEKHPFGDNEKNVFYQKCSITDVHAMEDAFDKAEDRFGTVATCIALASLDLSVLPQVESLADADPKDWRRVLDVNVHGTFLTAQKWLQSVRRAALDPAKASQLKNIGLVIVGSVAGRFGVRTMPAYSAGKAAVQ